jgi:hypothetical protein
LLEIDVCRWFWRARCCGSGAIDLHLRIDSDRAALSQLRTD